MILTPFHSESIWKTYLELRPREATIYSAALREALEYLKNLDTKKIRILVLGAGPGLYDVDPLFEVLKELTIGPEIRSITIVDWHKNADLKYADAEFKNVDIEEFLANEKEKSFDLVVGLLVAHHFVNWRLALANIVKVASGGILVFDEYLAGNAGWIDWVDGTNGFVGLDINKSESTLTDKWKLFFRDYYSYLDRKYGIFWEPEVRGTDYKRFHSALLYSGFEPFFSREGKTTAKLRCFLDAFVAANRSGELSDPAHLFSQFKWGEGENEQSYLSKFIDEISSDKPYFFIKSLTSNVQTAQIPEDETVNFWLRVSLYKVPDSSNHTSVLKKLSDTYWFDGFNDSLLHRLLLPYIDLLSTQRSKNDDWEKLQRKKLLQFLIFSGAFTNSMVFASPVLMTIKKVDGWRTETSEESMLIVNKGSNRKCVVHMHLQRMAEFVVQKKVRSLTESFLGLQLPVSIVLRKKLDSEVRSANNKVSITLHELHTGKLFEVAIPDRNFEDVEYEQRESDSLPLRHEWRFGKFRAGILKQLPPEVATVLSQRDPRSLEFEENPIGVLTEALDKIKTWICEVLPFVEPVLKKDLRVSIIGLYHVRINDHEYGGLGSIFLTEDILGGVTDFDLNRMRFIQAKTQKFSSVYMLESLRQVTFSEESLEKQMESYRQIKAPLEELRMLNVQMSQASAAISAIEAELNPKYLFVAENELKNFFGKLETLFGSNHDVIDWGDRDFDGLSSVWLACREPIIRELEKSSFANSLAICFISFESDLKVASGTLNKRKAAYCAKAFYEGSSPLLWVIELLQGDCVGEKVLSCAKVIQLGEAIPVLAFNAALIAIKSECVEIKHNIEETKLVLDFYFIKSEDKVPRDLYIFVLEKLRKKSMSFSTKRTSTALALLVKASNEFSEWRNKDGSEVVEEEWKIKLSYSLKVLK